MVDKYTAIIFALIIANVLLPQCVHLLGLSPILHYVNKDLFLHCVLLFVNKYAVM